MKKIIILGFLGLINITTLTAKQYELLSYHNLPPFMTMTDKEGKGLSFRLTEMLNKALPNHSFKFAYLPRKRIDERIHTDNTSWLVTWVNPIWFGDKDQKTFHWIELFNDANVIVSRADNPIHYQKPEDLFGKNFGGVLGHFYLGIDDYTKGSPAKINRIDSSEEEKNLQLLLHKRIDATLLPLSSWNYYKKLPDYQNDFYQAEKPHQQYTRYLMIPKAESQLAQELETAIKTKAINFDLLFSESTK